MAFTEITLLHRTEKPRFVTYGVGHNKFIPHEVKRIEVQFFLSEDRGFYQNAINDEDCVVILHGDGEQTVFFNPRIVAASFTGEED